MFDSPQAIAAIIAAVVALLTSVFGSLVTIVLAERRLSREMRLAEERFTREIRLAEQKFKQEFKLDFAAENVARALLLDQRWQYRTFDTISYHLGGFVGDELRKILVRAGAIRFRSQTGEELWGLLERNPDLLGVDGIEDPPSFDLGHGAILHGVVGRQTGSIANDPISTLPPTNI